MIWPYSYDRKNKTAKKRRTADQDDQGDVTYINQRNKVFNQKINRFFDKYTQECVFRSNQLDLVNSFAHSRSPCF